MLMADNKPAIALTKNPVRSVASTSTPDITSSVIASMGGQIVLEFVVTGWQLVHIFTKPPFGCLWFLDLWATLLVLGSSG